MERILDWLTPISTITNVNSVPIVSIMKEKYVTRGRAWCKNFTGTDWLTSLLLQARLQFRPPRVSSHKSLLFRNTIVHCHLPSTFYPPWTMYWILLETHPLIMLYIKLPNYSKTLGLNISVESRTPRSHKLYLKTRSTCRTLSETSQQSRLIFLPMFLSVQSCLEKWACSSKGASLIGR